MRLTLSILTIIASWLYHLPTEWAVTLTVFAGITIACAIADWSK